METSLEEISLYIAEVGGYFMLEKTLFGKSSSRLGVLHSPDQAANPKERRSNGKINRSIGKAGEKLQLMKAFSRAGTSNAFSGK
jgi:hypothetical protein